MERKGYNPNFIDPEIEVPLPKFAPSVSDAVLRNDDLREGIYADYIHYSVVMNRKTRQLVYAASNIDQNQDITYPHDRSWRTDSNVGEENQLDDPDYYDNPWDKGHMVMRDNNNWGRDEQEAKLANDDTYWYTNAAFQHKNLNRDEWKALEMHIGKGWILDENGKLCVFTGPIHLDDDRYYTRNWDKQIRIPSGFFKVVVFKSSATGKMATKAFHLYQEESVIANQRGSKHLKQEKFIKQQVSLTEITELTGLVFSDSLYNSNPLLFKKEGNEEAASALNVTSFPERITVIKSSDLIDDDTTRTTEINTENRSIIINAMMVNPTGSDKKGEWISIQNISNKNVQLSGWTLVDDKNRSISLSGTVQTGQTKRIRMEDADGNIKLTNTGGAIKLMTKDNQLMDVFRYVKEDVREGMAVIR